MAWTTQRKKEKGDRAVEDSGSSSRWKKSDKKEPVPVSTNKWHDDDEPEQDEEEDDYDRKYDYVEGLVAKATVKVVQLDGLVLLKIIKHASEKAPEAVTGLLLGLDIGDRLEATSCFPIPVDKDDEDDGGHQISMMKALAEVNVDNNTVGWYQSALLGTWCNRDTIEDQFKYQTEIPNSVVVVYDPSSTTRGRLALKAYRLTGEFMELFASGDFSHTGFSKRKLDSTKIFEEIPIKVHNSHLVHGFLYELREQKSMSCGFDRLHRSAGPFLTKTLGILSTHIDEYCSELNRFQFGQRLIARHQKLVQEASSSRRDNEARIAQGQDPLDENGVPIKAPPQPSRLETFLIQNVLRDYCDQIQSGTSLAFNQLYVSKALQSSVDE
jgi:translation initiation factor 3 subunit H